MIRFSHVLCPIDLSDISQHVVDHAAAIARWYDARLTLLYVFVNRPTMDLPPLILEPAERDRVTAAMGHMMGPPGVKRSTIALASMGESS